MADENVKKIPVVSASSSADATQSATIPDIENEYSDVKKELATRFELLPEDLQKVIIDDGYQMKLFNIAKASKLTYEELGSLEMETTMVLLGMTKPADYRDELQIQIKKNDAEMDPIIAEINRQIFDPIKSSLERLYSTKKEPEDFLTNNDSTIAMPQSSSVPFYSSKPSTPATAPTLSPTDNNVLASTGVILTDTPAIVPSAPRAAMPNRNDVLQGIENPPKAPPASIIANKLTTPGPSIAPSKTTDYTIQKTITSVPSKPTTDPYREPIK